MEQIKQKWIDEGGILYPIPGYTTLMTSPGAGVFTVCLNSRTNRIGLSKLCDAFTFDFKIYDLGCDDIFGKVMKVWNSRQFAESSKNLGVIFNGLKGTGKTVAAKILSNRVGLPVIIIPQAYVGIQDFIASLCFECVVLIDEAEKTFKENQECLLKLIDGVYNEARKLYILTTNNLYLDENLLGRPGRIRYIKKFGNLTVKAVNDYIDDNLEDLSFKPKVLEFVDSLEISTIDILKSIVEEVNIMGEMPDQHLTNVPRALYRFEIMEINNLDSERFDEFKEFVNGLVKEGQTFGEWLNETWKTETDEDGDNVVYDNNARLRREFNCYCFKYNLPSATRLLFKEQSTSHGTILDDPDKKGWFRMEDNDGSHDQTLCKIVRAFDAPSLYRGGLVF